MGRHEGKMNAEQFDLMNFIQNLVTFLASEDSYVGKLPRRTSYTPTASRSSLDYKARAHGRLLEITNNISKTIVESCSGIDEICNKVRECLNDAHEMGIYEPKYSSSLVPVSENTLSETTEIIEHELEEVKTSLTSLNLKPTNTKSLKYKRHNDFQPFITMLNSSERPPTALRMNIERADDPNAIRINILKCNNNKVDEGVQNDVKEYNVVKQASRGREYDAKINHIDNEINEVNDIIQKDIEELRRDITKYKAGKKTSTTSKVEKSHGSTDELTNTLRISKKTSKKLSRSSTVSKSSSKCKGIQTVDADNSCLKERYRALQYCNVINNVSDNAFTEFEMDSELIKLSDLSKEFKDVMPDVYRKPAITDLFEKLLVQLEMNDSYICFQKLMNPPRKIRNYKTPQNRPVTYHENREGKVASDMKNNLNNSLWFSRKYLVREKRSTHKKKDMKNNSSNYRRSRNNSKKSSLISLTNYSSASSKCLVGSLTRTNPKMNSRNSTGTLPQINSKCKMQVWNERSLSIAEKKRLQWIRAKNLQAPIRRLECLDILDDLTIRDLQPIQAEYPRKDKDRNFVKNCYLTKLLQDSNHDTWQHLLQPNIPIYEEQYDIPVKDTNIGIKLQDRIYSREDVIKILQPYLFDPIQCGNSVLTVLPVHVYYDNVDIQRPFKGQTNNRKCTTTPMEECKNSHKAKWISPEQMKKSTHNQPHGFKNSLSKAEWQKIEAEIEEQSKQRIETNMTKSQRNLWAHKYARTVGKQLIDFIDHQAELPSQPLPKYMIPITKKVEPSKLKKYPQVQNKSVNPEKKVLSHLKDLRNKNHLIQNNIENTIHKIENKMMNILNEPYNKDNIQTFNSMEKEISNVLTMMKRSPTTDSTNIPVQSPKVTTPPNLKSMRDDLDSISDDLFKKLEKILDDAGISSSESKSSINSRHKMDFQKVINDIGISNTPNLNTETKEIFSSKTKVCLSTFTTITEDELEEKINQSNLVIPHGDQNVLPSSQPLIVAPPLPLPEVQINMPNSRGDYCPNGAPDKETNNNNEVYINSKKQSPKDNVEQKQPEEERSYPVVDELTMKKIEFQRHLLAVETLEQIIKTEDVNDFEKKNKHKFIVDIKEPNHIHADPESLQNSEIHLLGHYNNVMSKNFPEKVNKIIKRVEDIYTQLEDIHNTGYCEDIPKFQDNQEIMSITSEEFLTPFMKDLKNKRKSIVPSHDEVVTDNSSCANVMNFLEKMNSTENIAKEIHFARLCYLPTTQTASIKYTCNLEHKAILDEIEKPSCLKRNDECKIKKKVSFLVAKEEKGNQVEICPHHRIKLIKTSSHQFPPLEQQEEPEYVQSGHIENLNNIQLHLNDTVHNPNKVSIPHESDTWDGTCQTHDTEADDQNYVHEENEIINEYSEVSETRSESLSQSKSSDPYVFSEPQITVYCDEYNKKNPQVVVKSILSSSNTKNKSVLNSNGPTKGSGNKPKIILFREMSNIAEMLSPFKNINNFCSSKSSEFNLIGNGEIESIELFRKCSVKEENTIILLKSLYAVVYILMFTALNLEYMCVHG